MTKTTTGLSYLETLLKQAGLPLRFAPPIARPIEDVPKNPWILVQTGEAGIVRFWSPTGWSQEFPDAAYLNSRDAKRIAKLAGRTVEAMSVAQYDQDR